MPNLEAGRLIDESKIPRNSEIPGEVAEAESGETDEGINGTRVPLIRLKVRTVTQESNSDAGAFPELAAETIRPLAPTTATVMNESNSGASATPEPTVEAIRPLAPTTAVELEPKNVPASVSEYLVFKPRRYRDGPKLRARRAKSEAIRAGEK